MKIACRMCTAKRMIPPQVTQFTVRDLSYCKHKNWKKNLWKSISNVNDIPRRPGLMFEQHKRAISTLTSGMSARDIAWHFQRHESTISRLLNRFQQTGNVVDWPDQADRVKPVHFLMTSSRRNRFLSSWKLGPLLRNATGTRVCDRTVKNRLHATRLKACHPYVGILLMWRNYLACCCTILATT